MGCHARILVWHGLLPVCRILCGFLGVKNLKSTLGELYHLANLGTKTLAGLNQKVSNNFSYRYFSCDQPQIQD
jgi:hypothetical protein